jgi:hypothetical protein
MAYLHHNHRSYRTPAARAADARVASILDSADPHPASCQCWGCCADAFDCTPDMGDPHEPNDERGWWEDVNFGEPAW